MNDYSLFFTRFAATYDCGAYGAGTYNNNDVCPTTTTGSSSGSSGGILANTGMDVLIPLALGIVLILSAIAILLRSRRKKARR